MNIIKKEGVMDIEYESIRRKQYPIKSGPTNEAIITCIHEGRKYYKHQRQRPSRRHRP